MSEIKARMKMIEFLEKLAEQWENPLPWTFSANNENDEVSLTKTLLVGKCIYCGKEILRTPDGFLSMKDKQGYSCGCRLEVKTKEEKLDKETTNEKKEIDANENRETEEKENKENFERERLEKERLEKEEQERIDREKEEKRRKIEEFLNKKKSEIVQYIKDNVFEKENYKDLGLVLFEENISEEDVHISEEGNSILVRVKCNVCDTVHDYRSEELLPISFNGKKIHSCKTCSKEIMRDGEFKRFVDVVKSYLKAKKVEYVEDEKIVNANDPLKFKLKDGSILETTFKEFVEEYGEIDDVNKEFIVEDEKEKEELDKEIEKESIVNEEENDVDEEISEESEHDEDNSNTEESSEEEKELEPFRERESKKKVLVVDVDNLVDDSHIADLEKERKREESKRRAKEIFVDENVLHYKNPLEDLVNLEEEFYEGPFGRFFVELHNKTGINYKLRINKNTLEIPFVEFENGFRFVCINLDEPSLYNINPSYVSSRCDFFYKEYRNTFKTIFLYSDCVRYRKTATMRAIIKHIAPELCFENGALVSIRKNFKLFYSTDRRIAVEFENRHSPNPRGKPVSSSGIISLMAKSDEVKRDSETMNMLFLKKFLSGDKGISYNDLGKEFSLYTFATIRYIDKLDKLTNTITVYVTDYTETTKTMVSDGLYIGIVAIMKEMKLKYPEVPFEYDFTKIRIIVERDVSYIPSPTVRRYFEEDGETEPLLVPFTAEKRFLFEGKFTQPIDVAWIRLPEFRIREEDNFRQDYRYFEKLGTMITLLSADIKKSGVQIRTDEQKNKFLFESGYRKILQYPIEEYLADPIIFTKAMYEPELISMVKINFNNLGF